MIGLEPYLLLGYRHSRNSRKVDDPEGEGPDGHEPFERFYLDVR